MSGTIFVTFAISVTWLCTSLFQIHAVRGIISTGEVLYIIFENCFYHFQHLNSINYLLLQSIMTTTALVLILFIFCYYGNMVTSECQLVSISAYDTLWYLYPIELQKYIIPIMQRSQQPFYFTGFKITVCSLQSFTNVSRPLNVQQFVADE